MLTLPDIRAKLIAVGMNPEPSTPEALKTFVDEDTRRWGEVVKAVGIKLE